VVVRVIVTVTLYAFFGDANSEWRYIVVFQQHHKQYEIRPSTRFTFLIACADTLRLLKLDDFLLALCEVTSHVGLVLHVTPMASNYRA